MKTVLMEAAGKRRVTALSAFVCSLFVFAAFCPIVHGWGGGHDVVGKAVAERLPEPWKSRLADQNLTRFLADNHYPDSGLPLEEERWGEENIKWLRDRGIQTHYDFHKAVNRAHAFELLVRTIRAKDDERTFLLLAVLAHSISDQTSCNHDPLVHLVTYGWTPDGLNLCRSLPLDAGWLRQYDWSREIFESTLESFDGSDASAAPNDIFCRLINDEWEGTRGFSEGVRIIEAASRFSESPEDRAAGESLAKSLSILAAWGVERTVKTFNAAVRFAQTGEKVESDEKTIQPACRRFAEEFAANRPLSDDPWAVPFLPKNGVSPRVGILYDPTGKFGDGFFSFLDRILTCMIAGTLQKTDDAALVDLRRFNREGADAAKTKILIVCANTCHSWLDLSTRDFYGKLGLFQRSGGKIVWIGMTPPRELAPEIVDRLQFGRDKQGYCKPAYPVPMDTLMESRVALTGEQGESWPFVRKPVGSAGWFWFGGRAYMTAPAAPEIRPLLELRSPDAARIVGFASPAKDPRFAMLPTYALVPYILTDETPQLSPLKLCLDSAGETILLECLKALGRKQEESGGQGL